MNSFFNSQSLQLLAITFAWLYLISFCQSENSAQAATKTKRTQSPAGSGTVYPQFRSKSGNIHWLSEQMPLKVYVSPGLSIEKIIDPNLGACAFNVDNLDHWPDVAADLLQQPEQMAHLPLAQGFYQEYYQAAIDGINEWKPFEKKDYFPLFLQMIQVMLIFMFFGLIIL